MVAEIRVTERAKLKARRSQAEACATISPHLTLQENIEALAAGLKPLDPSVIVGTTEVVP
jgi:hypothetical protein